MGAGEIQSRAGTAKGRRHSGRGTKADTAPSRTLAALADWLCALAGNGIALSPDVQAQGVGAHQRPGVQLGAAPCKCLPCAAQGKGERQAKAEQRHLRACKHSG